MVRYSIDPGAVLGVIATVEGELSAVERADQTGQAVFDAVETALRPATVGTAFTGFASAVVMADVKATVYGAANAVGGTSDAVAAYRSGDAQMAADTVQAASNAGAGAETIAGTGSLRWW